jgi:hypothetical protein
VQPQPQAQPAQPIPANEDPFKKAQATAARAEDTTIPFETICPFETGKGTLGMKWDQFDTANLEFVMTNSILLQAQFPSLTNAHLNQIRCVIAERGGQK